MVGHIQERQHLLLDIRKVAGSEMLLLIPSIVLLDVLSAISS